MGTTTRRTVWLGVCAGLLLPGLAARAQDPPVFLDAVSREFTLFLGEPPRPVFLDAVSREFTIFLGTPPTPEFHDAVSRELTLFRGTPPIPEFGDAISREFSLYVPPPDLEAVCIAVEPDEGFPGDSFTVTWSGANSGGLALGSWTDRVYVSSDDQVGNDTLLAESTVEGPLAGGDSYQRSVAVPFPAQPGQRWIFVEVNAGGGLIEPDRSGNTCFFPLPIRVQQRLLPDLTVLDIVPPNDGVLAGTCVDVRFTVRNTSANDTGVCCWVDSVFLVPDAHLNPDLAAEPYFLGQFPNPAALPGREGYGQVVTACLPERIAGTYRIAVSVDSRRPDRGPWRKCDAFDVLEEDDCNNWAFSPTFRIDVGDARPDLEVTRITVLPEAFYLRRFEVSWSVTNAGEAATPDGCWRDRVYASLDGGDSIGEADLLLGAREYDGDPLAAGASYALPVSLDPPPVLPPDLTESFYIKVVTDAEDDVWEPGFGEANNVGVSPLISLIPTPVVDLEPVDVEAPAAAAPGHCVDVAVSVRRTGGFSSDVPLAWRDGVYLSADEDWDPREDRLLGTLAHGTTTDGGGNIILEDYDTIHEVCIPPETPDGRPLPEGTYHFIAVVSVEGFDDFDRNNNWLASAAVNVSYESMDLSIVPGCGGVAAVAPEAAPRGGAIALSWQVTNIGMLSTPVSFWRDGVWLSDDAELDPGDTVLATAGHSSALGGGGSYCPPTQFARLPDVPPGGYFLLFATDIDGVLDEVPSDPGADAEGNNVESLAFEITDPLPDLVVTEIRCPETVSSGEPLDIGWTVANQGDRDTPTFWIDRAYLSSDDALDESDVFLASWIPEGSVGPQGGDYEALPDGVMLPADLSGSFHVIVVTDADGAVIESDEGNNRLVKDVLLNVDLTPPADLVVLDVVAPAEVTAGQEACVSWRVTNEGAGPTEGTRWRDSVYLSRDNFLDMTRDTYLGSLPHQGVLGAGESYPEPVERCLDVPLGASGEYHVFVVTDASDRIFEKAADGGAGEGNNASYDPFPMNVVFPPASDLTVAEVLPPDPAEGVLGETIVVRWTLRNQGGAPVRGRLFDAVYLSADATWDVGDRLLPPAGANRPDRCETDLSELDPDRTLSPGEDLTASCEVTIPGVLPGEYYLIVRADVYNQIPEDGEENNSAVSAGTVTVGVQRLELGRTHEHDLVVGDEAYFLLTGAGGGAVPSGETIEVTFEHSSPAAWTELYVRLDEVPQSGRYDYRFDRPAEPVQRLKIPGTREGSYYLLARVAGGDLEPWMTAVRTRAELIPFAVDSVRPDRVGNTGPVTLRVEGSRFEPGDRVCLRRGEECLIDARSVEVADAAQLTARFLLDAALEGSYELAVRHANGDPAEGIVRVEVEPVAPPVIVVETEDPPPLRRGASGGSWDWVIANRGNVDAEYVFLFEAIEATEGRELLGLRSSSPFAAHVSRDGFLLASSIIRRLAPGERAVLSTTLRAGTDPSDILSVGRGIALLSSRRFLEFQEAAAASVRREILADPNLLRLERRNDVLGIAHDEADDADDDTRWRDYWFAALRDAGLVGADDVADYQDAGGGNGISGEVRCGIPEPEGEVPAFFDALDEMLCQEWIGRLVATGVKATGDFAASPGALAAARLACSLEDFTACTSVVYWAVHSAVDPNEKEGPDGVGDGDIVPKNRPLRYTIRFENEGDASAPAAVVTITDPLDDHLNIGSVRLGKVAFGDTIIEPSSEVLTLRETVDLTETRGVHVKVLAGVNTLTRQVLWIFRGIDPLTGEVPAGGLSGFLPPGEQGWVEFSVELKRDQIASGIVVENPAEITFDDEEPIDVMPTRNVIDGVAPTSVLEALLVGSDIDLLWRGSDGVGGAGLAAYSVFVAKDGGALEPLVEESAATSMKFKADPGHEYCFYVQAVDFAGNVEALSDEPDACVTAEAGVPFIRGDADGSGRKPNITDAVRILDWLFRGGPEPPCQDAADCDDSGAVNITDPVFLLDYLFRGGGEPPSPGPETCGPDPTEEDELPECEATCSPG